MKRLQVCKGKENSFSKQNDKEFSLVTSHP